LLRAGEGQRRAENCRVTRYKNEKLAKVSAEIGQN